MDQFRTAFAPELVEIVLYHYPCNDGTMAACVAKKFNPGIRLIAFDYNVGLSDAQRSLLSDRVVCCIDIALSRENYHCFASAARSLAVIDHHATSLTELAGLQNVLVDVEHCGSVLAWEFFFPGHRVPRALLWTEEQDLWRFTLAESRPFAVFMRRVIGCDVEAAFKIAFQTGDYSEILDAAAREVQVVQAQVEQDSGLARKVLLQGHQFVAVESSRNVSELGGYPVEAHGLPVAVLVRLDGRPGYRVSLRSADHLLDVGHLAQSLGGGGHRNASAFYCPSPEGLFSECQ